MSLYQLLPNGVLRTSDGAQIPNDANNRDWRDYQAWLVLGNVPDAIDPSFATAQAQQAQDAANRAAAKADATVALLASKTPAQIDAYIVANVVDLPSAKAVIRALAQVCGVLAKDM